MNLQGNILIAQGGGPTAVINQSLVGAILEARRYPEIDNIYGAVHGVEGIVNEDLLDLTRETTVNLEKVARTTCAALRSTRDKPDEKYCEKIFEVLKAHNVRYFFYIGGNDSSDTVRIVNDYAKQSGYDFRAIHIPKTIDNDVVLNDHTPGYGSAAKFVTQCFIGADLETRALKGIYIGIVMGRHAGFLTAASSLAKKMPDDGPHLIYLPERAFDPEKFTVEVQDIHNKYGRCVIAVSEGIKDRDGTPIATKLKKNVEKDSHGNVQLSGGQLGDMLTDHLKKNLGAGRVRADTFGYLQRSFIGCISEVDQAEAREAGAKAVHFAVSAGQTGSVIIKRTGNYDVAYELVELEKIAAKTRLMPDSFINEQGNHVTRAFEDYARPLIGTQVPEAYNLKAPKVKKILK